MGKWQRSLLEVKILHKNGICIYLRKTEKCISLRMLNIEL